MDYKELVFNENGEVTMPLHSSTDSLSIDESLALPTPQPLDAFPDLKYIPSSKKTFLNSLFFIYLFISSHPYIFGFFFGILFLILFRFVL